MALKARTQTDDSADTGDTQSETSTDQAERGLETDDRPDDHEPDIEVESDGERQVVRQRSNGTRGERRAAERKKKWQEEQTALLEAQMAPLRTQLQQLQQLIAQGGQVQQRVQQPERPETEPKARYRQIARKQSELVELMNTQLTPKRREELEEEWHDLEWERSQLVAETTVTPHLARLQQQQANRPSAEEQQLEQEFADVLSDQDAVQLAKSYFIQERTAVIRENRSRAAVGKPAKRFDVMAAHRKALTRAGQEMGIYERPAAAPSEAQRDRFAGEAGSGPRGRGGNAEIELTAEEKRSARMWARDEDIPEEDVYRRYVSEVLLNGDPDYFRRPGR